MSFSRALNNIRRSPFQALAAVSVLTITFFMATLLAVVLYSSSQIIRYFETRPQIIAFLKHEAPAAEITKLFESLKADKRVKNVRYESKESALQIYKAATADNPLLSELVSPSIFPASIEFSVVDLQFAEDVVNEVKQKEIVDQVGFTASLGSEDSFGNVIKRLQTISFYLRAGGSVMVGLLALASLLTLLVIISMRLSAKRQEVEILRLVGAKPGFIRGPILAEAVIYSTLGVVLGWVIVLILFLYASPTLVRYFAEIPVIPRNLTEFMMLFGVILALELAVGYFLAIFGSLLAISRVKDFRKKR